MRLCAMHVSGTRNIVYIPKCTSTLGYFGVFEMEPSKVSMDVTNLLWCDMA